MRMNHEKNPVQPELERIRLQSAILDLLDLHTSVDTQKNQNRVVRSPTPQKGSIMR